jgi:hypothetical protein
MTPRDVTYFLVMGTGAALYAVGRSFARRGDVGMVGGIGVALIWLFTLGRVRLLGKTPLERVTLSTLGAACTFGILLLIGTAMGVVTW